MSVRPQANLGQNELCYYQINAGLPEESKDAETMPEVDKYMLLTIRSITDIKASVLIGNSTQDPYIDQCTLLQDGDVIFARHPYKFFPLFQGSGTFGMYTVDFEYSTSNDLSETVNRQRCRRVNNILTAANDTKIGSTIGGKYGYGYATDPENDILPQAAADAQPTDTSATDSEPSETDAEKEAPIKVEVLQASTANILPFEGVTPPSLRPLQPNTTFSSGSIVFMILLCMLNVAVIYYIWRVVEENKAMHIHAAARLRE